MFHIDTGDRSVRTTYVVRVHDRTLSARTRLLGGAGEGGLKCLLVKLTHGGGGLTFPKKREKMGKETWVELGKSFGGPIAETLCAPEAKQKNPKLKCLNLPVINCLF